MGALQAILDGFLVYSRENRANSLRKNTEVIVFPHIVLIGNTNERFVEEFLFYIISRR